MPGNIGRDVFMKFFHRVLLCLLIIFVLFSVVSCSPKTTIVPNTSDRTIKELNQYSQFPYQTQRFVSVNSAVALGLVSGLSSIFSTNILSSSQITSQLGSDSVGEIAYIYKNNIWLLNLESNEIKQITNIDENNTNLYINGMAWSPDGSWLAFSSNQNGNPHIFMISADGSILKQVTTGSSSETLPAFIAKSALLFVRTNYSGNSFTGEELIKHDLKSGNEESIYKWDIASWPSSISVNVDSEIAITGFDGTGGGPPSYWSQLITQPGIRNFDAYYPSFFTEGPCKGQHHSVNGAVWAHELRYLAFVDGQTCTHDINNNGGTIYGPNSIYIIDFTKDTPQATKIFTEDSTYSLNTFDWSPDNQYIIFSETDFSHNPSLDLGIWIVNIHTGELKQISQIGTNPLWRPQGSSQNVTQAAPTPIPQPTQVLSQATQAAPSLPPDGPRSQSGFWCFIPGFCVQAAETNTTCHPQCVETANILRPDLPVWGSVMTSDQILAIAQSKPLFSWKNDMQQVRVRGSNETPQAGDLIIWPSNCDHAWSGGGHIGYVTNGNPLTITDSNWDGACGLRTNQKIAIQSCMRFITQPYPALQPDFSAPGGTTPSATSNGGLLDWIKKIFGGK